MAQIILNFQPDELPKLLAQLITMVRNDGEALAHAVMRAGMLPAVPPKIAGPATHSPAALQSGTPAQPPNPLAPPAAERKGGRPGRKPRKNSVPSAPAVPLADAPAPAAAANGVDKSAAPGLMAVRTALVNAAQRAELKRIDIDPAIAEIFSAFGVTGFRELQPEQYSSAIMMLDALARED